MFLDNNQVKSSKKGEFISIVKVNPVEKETLIKILNKKELSKEQESVKKRVIQLVDIEEYYENTEIVNTNDNLLRILTVKENILVPIKLSNKKIEPDYINEIIDLFNIRSILNNYPKDITFYEKQKVGIVKALALKSKYIILDDVIKDLEYKESKEIMKLLDIVKLTYNQKILIFTDNKKVAKKAKQCIC